MANEPSDFRGRLLGAQQVTPALQEAYRKEVEAIGYRKLTPVGRRLSWAWAAACAAAAGACVWSVVVHHGTARAGVDYYINISVYFALFVWLAVGAVRNAVTGGHTWKSYFNVAGAFYTAAGVTVVLALLHGMRDPHDPASVFGAVFALVFLVVCLGWALQSRIDAGVLKTREAMLRVEMRLADLAEKVAK